MDQVLEYAIKTGSLSWVAFFGLLVWTLKKNEAREKAMQSTIDNAQTIIKHQSEKLGIRLEVLEKDMTEIKTHIFNR